MLWSVMSWVAVSILGSPGILGVGLRLNVVDDLMVGLVVVKDMGFVFVPVFMIIMGRVAGYPLRTTSNPMFIYSLVFFVLLGFRSLPSSTAPFFSRADHHALFLAFTY